MREHNSKLRLLLLSEDKYPPFRSDVKILFGKEIAGRGHHIDWILQSDDDCERSYKTTWYGCRVWVGKTNNGTSRVARLKKHIYSIQSDLRMFSLLRKGRYDFIQVKDKFISKNHRQKYLRRKPKGSQEGKPGPNIFSCYR